MKKCVTSLIILLTTSFSPLSQGDAVNLPIQLDYGLIKKVVVNQLFKDGNNAVEVWKDKHGCSFLKLSNPDIGGEDGQIKLRNDVDAQLGTAIGGQCLPLLAWAGMLETLQKPTISADHSVLSLPITQTQAYDRSGQRLNIDKLQNLIKKAAEPKLSDIKIDLNKSRDDIKKTVAGFLPKENAAAVQPILDSLKFNQAEANDNGIKVTLGFDAPLKAQEIRPEAPFTEAEQKQWQATWKEWDAFLSKAIDQAADESKSPELKATLAEILAESRTAFQSGLKSQNPKASDPVRMFFVDTWQKLSPHLRTLAKDMPELESIKYLTFIAATDVIYELENLSAPLGFEITSDGLRKVLRVLEHKEKMAKSG